jgi:hypothetical protein
MAADPTRIRFVSVVCKTCDTRLDERVDDAPRSVACPVCFSPVEVPSASAAAPPTPPQPSPIGETYVLLDPRDPASQEKLRRANRVILVVCPICGARLHCEPKREPYSIQCPDCHELVRVPSRAEAKLQQRAATPAPPPTPVLPEGPAWPVRERSAADSPGEQLWHLRQMACIRREPDAKPPRSLFFSETFSIPWRRDVRSCWAWLSLGFTLLGLLGSVSWSVYEQTSGGYSGVVLAFFALPLVWIALWTGSYAAVVWQVVVVDTASGLPEMGSWEEHPIRDYLFDLVFMQYWLGLAAALSHGLGWLAYLPNDAPGAYWIAFGIGVVLLFPILSLSALERGARWNVASPLVWSSLGRRPGVWLAFYLLSTGLVGISALATRWCWDRWPWGSLPPLSVVWGAVVLIHARWLGRVGWAITR